MYAHYRLIVVRQSQHGHWTCSATPIGQAPTSHCGAPKARWERSNNIRFVSLFGLKSDIFRGPRGAPIADFRLIAGRRFPALSPPFCSKLKNLAL
jgi:hypothetical protein